jgi:hypothetical protein
MSGKEPIGQYPYVAMEDDSKPDLQDLKLLRKGLYL